MGVYRALPARAACGEQSSAAQETSYLGVVTSTREGTVPPGQRLVSAHHPRERQAGSPQAWARLPVPNTYSAGGQGR